jgi:hypothetical protein
MSEEHEAGVVDQDVEAAEPLDDGLDSPLGLGAVGDVRRDGEGGAPPPPRSR